MKYNNLTLGRVEAIVNKLGGEGMVDCFLDGSHPLQLAAVPELHFRLRMKLASFDELRAALKRTSYVDESLAQSLRQFEVGEVELVLVHCLVRNGLDLADAPSWMRDRGLIFVDPFVLMAWNAAHPEFSKTCPNLTQHSDERLFPIAAKFEWRDPNQAIFELREQQHRSWGSNWWFAGTPIL